MSEKSERDQGEILLLPESKGELIAVADTSQAPALPEGLNLPNLITNAGDRARLALRQLLHGGDRERQHAHGLPARGQAV